MRKFFSNLFKPEKKDPSLTLKLDDWVLIPRETNTKKKKQKNIEKSYEFNVKDYIQDKYEHQHSNHTSGSENLIQLFEKALEKDVVNKLILKQIIWDHSCHEKYRPLLWKILIGYIPHIQYLHPHVLRERKIHYEGYMKSLLQRKDDETYNLLQMIRSGMSNTVLKLLLFRNQQLAKMVERITHALFVQYNTLYYNDSLMYVITIVTYTFLYEYDYDGQLSYEKELSEDNLLKLETDVYNTSSILIFKQLNDFFFGPHRKDIPSKIESYIKEHDASLNDHLKNLEIEYDSFIYIWFDTFLLSLLQNMEYVARIWDICLCSENFIETHILFCLFTLMNYSNDIIKITTHEELHNFLLNLPAYQWSESKFEFILSKVKDKLEKLSMYNKISLDYNGEIS